MPRITQAQYEEQKQKTAAVEADRDAWKSKMEELEKVFEPRVKECMVHHEELVKKLSQDIGERDARIAQLETELAEERDLGQTTIVEVKEEAESRVARISERAEHVLQTTILALMGTFLVVNAVVWSLRCNDPNEL